jgi:hypothetical protein
MAHTFADLKRNAKNEEKPDYARVMETNGTPCAFLDHVKADRKALARVLAKRADLMKQLQAIETEAVTLVEGPMRKAGKLDGMYLVPTFMFGAFSVARAIGTRETQAVRNASKQADRWFA